MSDTLPAPEARVGFHFSSYLLGLTTALILLGGALFLLRRPEPAAMQLQPPPIVPSPAPTGTPLMPTPNPLVVFVSGAVQYPGLYTLSPGARIGDAIAAAGGLLATADPALVNQAQPLVDGAQLHIPAAEPVLANQNGANQDGANQTQPAASAPAPGLSIALPTPTAVMPAAAIDAGGANQSPGQSAGAQSAAGLIDVNTATAADLESLPGIGPAKAQGIIDNRPYATVEELDRVPGIGPATLERLRPLVTTG
jgi:competence protein ComEA